MNLWAKYYTPVKSQARLGNMLDGVPILPFVAHYFKKRYDKLIMKILTMITLACLYSGVLFSNEKEVIDIENHPISQFPKISIMVAGKNIEYYGSTNTKEGAIEYIQEKGSISGEFPLSGYIFSKEFVESVRIPNTLANKKRMEEFIQLFKENDTVKIISFIQSVDERKRTAKNQKELDEITALIKKFGTDDDPGSTPYFSTGYIEIKPPNGTNERYFIKAADITKESVNISADKTKISLLKAMTIYSFQNVLSGLNFGNIEKGDKEDTLYNQLEKINSSLCGVNCAGGTTKDLAPFAVSVGQIVGFEVVGASKISDMDDFNKYILAQQFCLLDNFNKIC
jgi:hypothetical protein